MALPTIDSLFAQDEVQQRFRDWLGDGGPGYLQTVSRYVAKDVALRGCDPKTILAAAEAGASLGLSFDPNLGFVWMGNVKKEAQFHMGWKGFYQLAIRSGKYAKINVLPVYKNQFKSWDPLKEILVADFNKEGKGDPIGYTAFFVLMDGLEKQVYWSKKKVIEHAKKYSDSYSSQGSPWKTMFDAMALKTVLKNMLSRWGILSPQMSMAQKFDQAVIRDNEPHYVDGKSTNFKSKKKNLKEKKTKNAPQLP